MRVHELTAFLDDHFGVNTFPPDVVFASEVPRVYREFEVDATKYFTPRFLATGNGLMLQATESVEVINTTVFLSNETVEKAIALGCGPQLLCTHHPLDFETRGRGFLPLDMQTLDAALAAGISIYSVHTPLDVHPVVSTSRAWATRLGLIELEPYFEVDEGQKAGIRGRLQQPMSIRALSERVRTLAGVERVNLIEKRYEIVRVGIVAGGSVPSAIRLSDELGCDVFITGTYFNEVRSELGSAYRAEFSDLLPQLHLSLVECSHYASEMVVMRDEFRELCRRAFRLDGEFVPQEDPWH